MSTKKECTRDKIVDAARILFYRKGYGATSYADIANKADLAKGNVQYYFKSKEEILKAVTARRILDYQQMVAAWSAEERSPIDCLERFVDMFAKSSAELSRYGCPMGTLSGELGKAERKLQKEPRQLFAFFQAWLQEQFEQVMDSASAKEHAYHLMALAQGISVVGHVCGDKNMVAAQSKIVRSWLRSACGTLS